MINAPGVDANKVENLPYVTFSPAGGGVDDWPALIALMNAVAYQKAIILMPGEYVCKTIGPVPSGTRIYGSAGVTLTQTLPLLPYSPLTAMFEAQPVIGAATTLAANAGPGDQTISLTADVTVAGQYILLTPSHVGIYAGLRSRLYLVESISGAGPFTYTLDRPLRHDYVATDVVTAITPGQDIIIDGGGMLVTGVGQRFIELATVVNCTVKNIRGVALGGDIPFSYDIGSLDCSFENIDVDGGDLLNSCCIALESCERSSIVNCRARKSGPTTWGILLFDCDNCNVLESYGTENGLAGLGFVSDTNIPFACEDCYASGGDYSGNTLHGVWVTNGSKNISVEQVSAKYNGANGLQVGDGANPTSGVYFTDCDAGSNTSCGLGTQTPVSAVFCENCDFSGNLVAAASLDAEVNFSNCSAVLGTGAAAIMLMAAGAYDVRWSDCKFSSARVGGINNVQPGANVRLWLDGCDIGAASTCFVIDPNVVLRLARTRIYQTGGGIAALYANGGTIRIGRDVDADACVTPLAFSSGFVSRTRTVVANGVTPVNVAWPDIRSTERVTLSMNTPGGAPTAMPSTVVTANVGFVFTSYAADTSTYDYIIE